jgi:hypothetical protein
MLSVGHAKYVASLSSQVEKLEDDAPNVYGLINRECESERWSQYDREYQNAIDYIQKVRDVFYHLESLGFSTVGEVMRALGDEHTAIRRVLHGYDSAFLCHMNRLLEDNDRLDNVVIPTLTEMINILHDRREACRLRRS